MQVLLFRRFLNPAEIDVVTATDIPLSMLVQGRVSSAKFENGKVNIAYVSAWVISGCPIRLKVLQIVLSPDLLFTCLPEIRLVFIGCFGQIRSHYAVCVL